MPSTDTTVRTLTSVPDIAETPADRLALAARNRADRSMSGLAALLAACDPIPRDPERTLDRVRATRIIRVGEVAGDAAGAWRPLLARVAAATGARPAWQRDSLEPLLLRLEAGELDLVVGGVFAKRTPWKSRVTLGPVLRKDGEVGHHAVARNGENAWVMLLEREARALGHGS